MAKYSKCIINGKEYYRTSVSVGKKKTPSGALVDERKTFYGRKVSEVDDKINAYMKKKENGIYDKKQYFGIVADTWIMNEYLPKSNNQESTMASYIRSWNKYIKPSRLYSMPLDEITGLTISEVYQELFNSGVNNKALISIHRIMKKLYSYIALNRLGFDNTIGLEIPKAKKEITEKKIVIWTDEEINRIMNGFDKAFRGFRLRFLIVLALHTGARISELLGLDKADINEKERTLTISKQLRAEYIVDRYGDGTSYYAEEISSPKTNSSVRTIPLNDTVMKEYQIFKEWQFKDEKKHSYITSHLFTTENGTYYFRRNIYRALERYYKAIGVRYKNFHCYRHTFGTNLSKSGVPIETASALLGHSDISTTAKYYIGITQEQMRIAVSKIG